MSTETLNLKFDEVKKKVKELLLNEKPRFKWVPDTTVNHIADLLTVELLEKVTSKSIDDLYDDFKNMSKESFERAVKSTNKHKVDLVPSVMAFREELHGKTR